MLTISPVVKQTTCRLHKIYGRAHTPINISQLAKELASHPDREFVDILITGLTEGFDTGISPLPVKSFECNNLLSAVRDPEYVAEALHSEVDKGFMIGPFNNPPFASYRVSPIGVAVGKYSGKKRLIVDLSAPHDNLDVPSINSLIDKDTHSLKYVRIDDAMSLLKRLGTNACMCKTDIVSAFKLLPIKPSLWHLHGVKWEGRYYFCVKLAFGSRSSPKLFDQLSRAIFYIATINYRIPNVLYLLDDFLTIDSPEAVPERSRALLSHIFNILRIPTAPHKTMGPSPVMEFLGTVLDSTKMEARLPMNKLERMREMLSQFSQRHDCTKQELLSLIGHLVYASRVVIPGRTFVSYLIFLSTTVQNLFARIQLSTECQLDISMWSRFLNGWNGVSLFLDDDLTNSADFHLFSDASGIGYSGIYQHRWFQGKWDPSFNYKTNTAANMALLELFPIVVAAILWGNEWSSKKILFHCDNMATVHILNKGRSKCQKIMQLMRKLTLRAALCNFSVHGKHLPGVTNQAADFLSRFQNTKFKALVPQADPEPCPVPTLESILSI
jgi:hypothetical protein